MRADALRARKLRIKQPKALSILSQIFNSLGVTKPKKMSVILLTSTKMLQILQECFSIHHCLCHNLIAKLKTSFPYSEALPHLFNVLNLYLVQMLRLICHQWQMQ